MAPPIDVWLEVTLPALAKKGELPARATSQTTMINLWCLVMSLATRSKIK